MNSCGEVKTLLHVGLEELPDTVHAENIQLKATVQQLQEGIRELDASVQCTYTPLLMQQMDSLVRHRDQILHGPNTPARFSAFSPDV